MIYVDVDAGKKNSDSITIDKEELALQDVDTIATVEFSLEISDNDTWDVITNTEPIQIVADGNDTYVQEYDDSGEVLYDGDGIRIISRGLGEDYWGDPQLIVYAENNTEKAVRISSEDTSINDFMVGDNFSLEIPAGKHALGAMSFYESDLEEYQIETIEEIETSFVVIDPDTYDTLVESVPAIISFQ